MTSSKRLLVVALTVLLSSGPWWRVVLHAAIAEVAGQETSNSGDDVTLTLPGAVSASNHLIILVAFNSEAQTASITGTTMSFSTVMGPSDSPAYTLRAYIFCAQGDGVDTTFTVTTSGTISARSYAKEFSGTSCTAEDTEAADDTETSGNTFDLDEAGTPLASTAGALVVGEIMCAGNTTFTATTGTKISTDRTNSSSQWRVVGGAGNYDTTWTGTSTEQCQLSAASFAEVGGAVKPNGLLRGFF